ncbi:MAG: hypothetical protein ACK44B_07995 [Flavobacteriales bacterium]
MKRLILAVFLFVGSLAHTQSSAGVYKVRWTIDSRITNSFTINNTGTNRLDIPANLYDSVTNQILAIVKEELHTDAKLFYPLNSNGKEMRFNASSQQVGGLPRGNKRKATATEYLEYYVKFKIRVGVNKTFSVGTELASYNRLRPFVKVKMKAYGVDKRCKFRKRSKKTGFKSLHSFEYNLGGTTMTNTNALPINEVVDMVFQGLEKFRSKVR